MSTISTSIVSTFDVVTSGALDAANSSIKKAGGSQQALSAFLRTGRKESATIGALAYVWHKGIISLLSDGQKTALLGFSTASKKDSAALNTLIGLGILNNSGAILAGVEPGFKGSKVADKLSEGFPQFVALVQAETLKLSEAKKAAKPATETVATETVATETVATETVATETVAATLTQGQLDDASVERIIARIQAGLFSLENEDKLLAILAPYGVKPAPKARKVTV